MAELNIKNTFLNIINIPETYTEIYKFLDIVDDALIVSGISTDVMYHLDKILNGNKDVHDEWLNCHRTTNVKIKILHLSNIFKDPYTKNELTILMNGLKIRDDIQSPLNDELINKINCLDIEAIKKELTRMFNVLSYEEFKTFVVSTMNLSFIVQKAVKQYLEPKYWIDVINHVA